MEQKLKSCLHLLVLHHMTYLVHDLLIQLSILTHWICRRAAPVLVKQSQRGKTFNLIGYEHKIGDEINEVLPKIANSVSHNIPCSGSSDSVVNTNTLDSSLRCSTSSSKKDRYTNFN